jgi:hypothetical protein
MAGLVPAIPSRSALILRSSREAASRRRFQFSLDTPSRRIADAILLRMRVAGLKVWMAWMPITRKMSFPAGDDETPGGEGTP